MPEIEAAIDGKLTIESGQGPDCFITHRADGTASKVVYLFEAGRLARISITGLDQNASFTVEGVGIGATEEQIRATFGKLIIAPHQYDEADRYIAVRTTRKRGIVFETHNGRVTDIHAGSYPAVGYVEGCL